MNSWSDLEQRFRKLVPNLRPYRLDTQWGAAGEHWHLIGMSTNPAAKEEFEILATLAGARLKAALVDPELLAIADDKPRWYNALKSLSGAFELGIYGEHTGTDGSVGLIFTGTVRDFASASANLCLKLHAAHPVVVATKSNWQWLRWVHDNYVKAIIVSVVVALVVAALKLLLGL